MEKIYTSHQNKQKQSYFEGLQKPAVFTITKKVAKHGNQAIIIIPSFLQKELKPKTIVEVQITVKGVQNG